MCGNNGWGGGCLWIILILIIITSFITPITLRLTYKKEPLPDAAAPAAEKQA